MALPILSSNPSSSVLPIKFDTYFRHLAQTDPFVSAGIITDIVGLLIESDGPATAVGGFCEIQVTGGRSVRGKKTRTVVPLPSSLSMRTVPPTCLALP